jgi:Domain of unknown function (DUF1707)
MIPVIPVPVLPASDLDPVFGPDLRASDFDRDVAADMLCAAVADGRISLAELDQRLENVLAARTLREIARVMSDLPSDGPPASRRRGRPAPIRPAQVRPARVRPAQVRPARVPARKPVPSERWLLLQSLLAPAPAAAGGPG